MLRKTLVWRITAACLFLSSTVGEAWAAHPSIVHRFKGGTDGELPNGSLINVGGLLYGTTYYGGGKNCGGIGCGTVFSIQPNESASSLQPYTEKVIYAFQGSSDGAEPLAALINVGGKLYGTTTKGGLGANCNGGCGTVFSIDPTTGAETLLYSFKGGSDGEYPFASLLFVDGALYGTTVEGGAPGQGTLFKVDLKSGREHVLYAFGDAGGDGANPYANLIKLGGLLYGTTFSGGGPQHGTVFSLNTKTGAETVVYAFQGGSDGSSPSYGLINVGGILYGTTIRGAASTNCPEGCGTVYKVNPGTGAESVVYAFKGATGDGSSPEGGLIIVNGILYGTTVTGPDAACGGPGCGTVYSVNPDTGAETIVYSFEGRHQDRGVDPVGSLINVAGSLYGTTEYGPIPSKSNSYGLGTVFTLQP